MDLFWQAVVDADLKQRPVQRLCQMNVELIGQPLFI